MRITRIQSIGSESPQNGDLKLSIPSSPIKGWKKPINIMGYEIDYSNPLTRGLTHYLPSDGGAIVNLTNGEKWRTSGTGVVELNKATQYGTGSIRSNTSDHHADAPVFNTGYRPISTSDGAGTGTFTMLSFASPISASVRGILFTQRSSISHCSLMANTNTAGNASTGVFAFQTYNSTYQGVAHAGVCDGNFHIFVGCRRDGNSMELHVDGEHVKTEANASRDIFLNNSTNYMYYGGHNAGSTLAVTTPILLNAAWNRDLTESEIKSISRDPWQLLRPIADSTPLVIQAVEPEIIPAKFWLTDKKLVEPYLAVRTKKPLGPIEIDRTNPITRGMKICWAINENGGQTVRNLVENEIEDITWVQNSNTKRNIGPSGPCISSVGLISTDTAFTVPSTNPGFWHDEVFERTWFFHVDLGAPVASGPTILLDEGGGTNGLAIGFRQTPNTICFGVVDNAVQEEIASVAHSDYTKNIRICATYNRGKMRLTINGDLQGTSDAAPVSVGAHTDISGFLGTGGSGDAFTSVDGDSDRWDGNCYLGVAWDRAVSEDEAVSLTLDPYQIFRPKVQSRQIIVRDDPIKPYYWLKDTMLVPELTYPFKKPQGYVKIDWANPLTKGLGLYYLFHSKNTYSNAPSDANGQKIIDLTGRSQPVSKLVPINGTGLDATTTADGAFRVNNTGTFSGSDVGQYLQTDKREVLHNGYPLTLMLVAKRINSPALGTCGVSYTESTQSDEGLFIIVDGTYHFSVAAYSTPNGYAGVSATETVPQDELFAGIGVMPSSDMSTWRLYYNGKKLTHSVTGTGSFPTVTDANATLTIGGLTRTGATGRASYAGEFHAYAVFDRAINDQEAIALTRNPYQILQAVTPSVKISTYEFAATIPYKFWLYDRRLLDPYLASPVKKPVNPVEVNWRHPLAKGLKVAYIGHPTYGYINLVNKYSPVFYGESSIQGSTGFTTTTTAGNDIYLGYDDLSGKTNQPVTLTVVGDPDTKNLITIGTDEGPGGSSVGWYFIMTFNDASLYPLFQVTTSDGGLLTTAAISTTTLPTGKKAVITGTFAPYSSVTLYKHGVLDKTTATSKGVLRASDTGGRGKGIIIGRDAAGGSHASALDLILVHDRVLSDSEISSLGRSPYQIFQPTTPMLTFEITNVGGDGGFGIPGVHVFYDKFRERVSNGEINLSATELKCALTNDLTPPGGGAAATDPRWDPNGDQNVSDNEVAGTGYLVGGVPIDGGDPWQHNSPNVEYTAQTANWNFAGPTAVDGIRYAVVYDNTTKYAVSYVLLYDGGVPLSLQTQAISIRWNSGVTSGLLFYATTE